MPSFMLKTREGRPIVIVEARDRLAADLFGLKNVLGYDGWPQEVPAGGGTADRTDLSPLEEAFAALGLSPEMAEQAAAGHNAPHRLRERTAPRGGVTFAPDPKPGQSHTGTVNGVSITAFRAAQHTAQHADTLNSLIDAGYSREEAAAMLGIAAPTAPGPAATNASEANLADAFRAIGLDEAVAAQAAKGRTR